MSDFSGISAFCRNMLTVTLFLLAVVYGGPTKEVDGQTVCNDADGPNVWVEIGGYCIWWEPTKASFSYTEAYNSCKSKGAHLLSMMTQAKQTEYEMHMVGAGAEWSSQERWMRGLELGWDMGDQFMAPYEFINWNDPAVVPDSSNAATLLDGGNAIAFTWGVSPMDGQDANDKAYACEVCLDQDKCGIDVAMKMGPHQINDDNPCEGSTKYEGLKECDYCKCQAVTTKKKYSTPVSSRWECERMAKAYQQPPTRNYYSYLKLGPSLGFCSFKITTWDATNEIDTYAPITDVMCEESAPSAGYAVGRYDTHYGYDSSDNQFTKRLPVPWSIYKFHTTCKTCTRVIWEEQCRNCKCNSVWGVAKWPNKDNKFQDRIVVAGKDECAAEAYKRGFTYASYREDTRWCLYSKSKSSDMECGMGKRFELTKKPWVILGLQCMDSEDDPVPST